jgi:carbamoyl-phosphate synthase small subunit
VNSGALVLADGTRFEGVSVGADGVATGEVVFNTAMAGYQEIVTDPSYAGQIVVMTASHIGNYGTNGTDAQSETPRCTGLVVRAMSRRPSNWRSEEGFDAYLRRHGIVAIADVDTRRLTRHVRDHGAQPAAIGAGTTMAELETKAAAAPCMEGQDLTRLVTTPEPYHLAAMGERRGTVVAYDFGLKRDILRHLTTRGLDVVVVPATTPAPDVMAESPQGVFLSNGPGDPEPLTDAIDAVRTLLGEVPVFGICLGHQVLGLALGARTYKLPFGHHGGNHPVRRLADGRVEITSQNHGFAVDLWSLAGGAPPPRAGLPGPELLPAEAPSRFGTVVATHQNLNDGTLEGLACRDVPAFSVQYHPEAAPGPNDANGHFDRFVDLMAVG